MRQPRSPDAAVVDRHLGLRLRTLREAKGLTQAALGARIGGVSGQAVAKYEAGDALPAARLFWSAHVLGAPLAAFFEGLAAPPSPDAVVGVEEPAIPFDTAGVDGSASRRLTHLLDAAPLEHRRVFLAVVETLAAALLSAKR